MISCTGAGRMSALFERFPSSRRRLLPVIAILAALAPAVARAQAPASAAERPAGAVSSAPANSRALRQEIERRYEVLPLSNNGILLRPRRPEAGVHTIEIVGSSIAINGERTVEGVVRAWLGADAGPVLRLAALPQAERRALFD